MSSLTDLPKSPPAQIYSRKNPFLAELIGHERLTRPGSQKDTRHFVLRLEGSGLTYTPGDSLGAFGRNAPSVVDELLQCLECHFYEQLFQFPVRNHSDYQLVHSDIHIQYH